MKSEGIELIGVIGEAATVALAEAFGGTRLYVPSRVRESHRITRAIGHEAAQALSAFYSPDAIRVPLARELRAMHYQAKGLSHERIARKLGITATGVARLLKRVAARANAEA